MIYDSSKNTRCKWCLSFVCNAKRTEVIWPMRNLFSGEYKEGRKKSKKTIFVSLVLTCYKCLQKTIQITSFHLLESIRFQFLSSYLYHCVFMILIHSSKMQSFTSVRVTQLFIGQINIYMAFCITSHAILMNYKIVINWLMLL